jgi:hypothetical protein
MGTGSTVDDGLSQAESSGPLFELFPFDWFETGRRGAVRA